MYFNGLTYGSILIKIGKEIPIEAEVTPVNMPTIKGIKKKIMGVGMKEKLSE